MQRYCRLFFLTLVIMMVTSLTATEFASLGRDTVIEESTIPSLDRTTDDMPSMLDEESYYEWKRSITEAEHREYLERFGARREMDMVTENPYVRAVVDEATGAYEEGARPTGTGTFQKITYYYPSVPWSYSMYKIDAFNAEQQYRVGTGCSALPSPDNNYYEDGAIYTEWDNRHGVKIVQIIDAVSLGVSPGEIEQIKYTTLFIPIDGSCHDCGCLVYWDTKIGSDDAAEISTSEGYTGISEIFYAPDIPTIWRAYEGGYPPGPTSLQALGILTGFEAVTPDVFWYGQWGTSYGNGWDDTYWAADASGTFGDSAAMVKWYQRNVCPGDTLECTTYLGIGSFDETIVFLQHIPPTFEGGCGGVVEPNPFDVTALIINASDGDACNVTVSIDLPTGLTLEEGTTPVIYDRIADAGGAELTTWGISADPSIYGEEVCYDINMTYDDCSGGDAVTIDSSFCIDIPMPSFLETEVSADDTLLCLGESTVLHVGYHSGVPPYSFTWYSMGSPIYDPTATDPIVSPSATTTYIGYVIDSEDCVSADTVTVHVSTPLAEAGIWTQLCHGDSVQLGSIPTAIGGIEPYTYTWTPTTGLSDPTGSNPWASPDTTTMYYLLVEDSLGCSAFDSAYIEVSRIRIDAGEDTTLCRGESYMLGGDPTAFGGFDPYSYTWYPGIGLDDPYVPNPIATPWTTTEYVLEIYDMLGCYVTDTVVITVAASPVAEFVVPDICNGITTCENQNFVIWLADTTGSEIDESSIEVTLTVNGEPTTFDIGDSRLSYVDDTLRFAPDMSWEHGDTVHMLLSSFYNTAGCEGFPIDCSFIVDLEAPALISTNPEDEGTIHIPSPSIRFELEDDIAGIDTTTLIADNVQVWVNGILIEDGWTVSWDDPYFEIDGLSFLDGDSVYICLNDIMDNPSITYCPPNDTSYCFSFLVSMAGPGAEVIQYLEDSYVACDPDSQIFTMTLFDEDGIDESTIEVTMQIDAGSVESFGVGPNVSYDSDAEILTFTPPSPWLDGTDITICLSEVIDLDDNPMEEPVCATFHIDRLPPDINILYPEESFIYAPTDPAIFEVEISDDGAGVDPSSILLLLCGTEYPVTSVEAGVYTFDTGSEFGSFAPCTTACIVAADAPDYCTANYDTVCVNYILTSGPEAIIVEPLHATVSACDPQCITLNLFDSDLPVDDSSVEFEVEGTMYTVADPELSYNATTEMLQFCPAAGEWVNGQVINYHLIAASDEAGVPLETEIIDSFYIDLEAPVVSGASPVSDEVVGYSNPPVCFDINDNLAGVDFSSIEITVGGSSWTFGDPSLTLTADRLCFDPETAGLSWTGGTVINFCVHAADSPNYCFGNELDTCWSFEIVSGGPVGNIIDYSDGSYVSCDPQTIILEIRDDDGVIPDSIEVTIDRSSVPGISTIDISSPGVTWSEPEFRYTPPVPFVDGEEITVTVTDSYDELFNRMESFPSATFTIDISAPVVSGIIPAPGSEVVDPDIAIEFELEDMLSGLDGSSVTISINGVTHHSYDGCLEIDTTGNWVLDPSCFDYSGCDTLEINLIAEDNVDYCDDNELDTTWYLTVECAGPTPEAIHPLPGDTTACLYDSLVIRFSDDPPGIDETTIVFLLNGTEISWGDAGLIYYDATRTFVYTPPSGSFDEGVNTVEVRECDDLLGNPISTILTWSFLVDYSAPEFAGLSPICDSEVATTTPLIEFELFDLHAGVDTLSIELTVSVNGVEEGTYDISSPALTYTDPSGQFDATGLGWAGADTICIHYYAADLADDYPECPANSEELDCCFLIAAGGPVGTIIDPDIVDGGYNACAQDTIVITLVDPEGDDIVDESIEIHFGIHGCSGALEGLDVDDPRVTWDEAAGFIYIVPDPPLVDGDSVCVGIDEAEDVLMNTISRTDELMFIMDFTPPVIYSITPAPGEIVEALNPDICIELEDLLSGVNPSSIVLTIDGTAYTVGSSGITWDGTNLCLIPSDIGLSWIGGTEIEVSLHAEDSPDLCDPHAVDTTYTFSISRGGPIPTVIRSEEGAIVACNPDSVIWEVSDPNGILYSTALVDIHSWTGTDVPTLNTYSYGTELSNIGDYIIFNPGTDFFANGDSIEACLVALEDSLHNPIDDTSCVKFLVDRMPPVYGAFTPADGDTILTSEPIISFTLEDLESEIDSSSINIHIEPDGIDLDLANPCISIDRATKVVTINTTDCDLNWTGGTTVTITVSGNDIAWETYCGLNESSEQWSFTVAPGAPTSSILDPFDGSYSSCPDQNITIELSDYDTEVDPSSIELTVNGVRYTEASPELSFTEPLLEFAPSSVYSNGDIVHVTLDRACDIIGNCATSLLDYTFTIDLTPPEMDIIEPSSLNMIRNNSQQIRVELTDYLSGVDENSLVFEIDGIGTYTLGDFSWSETSDGGILLFNPEDNDIRFVQGDTVCFRIIATDSTDYCDDNELDSLTCFTMEPFVTCLQQPNPFTPNNDGVNDITLFEYPNLFTEEAELMIFDRRRHLVYESTIGGIPDFDDYETRMWNGQDNNGVPMPAGLYVYIIKINDKVVCNGTMVLVR